ncbi:MAG: capsule assembly Wzi family protein [Gemmatimonadota bacterium]
MSAGVLPEFAWSANGEFSFPRSASSGRSEFAHPDYSGIDWPKRFGNEPFAAMDAGQSYIRLDLGPAYATVSHENLWLGAAKLYPILLSNTAPGFWHLRLGTRAPVAVGPFRVDVQAFWGSVSESSFFDGNGANDSNILVGSTVSMEARFVPGLRIGFAAVGHFADQPLAFTPVLNVRRLVDTSVGKSGLDSNTIAALLASWVFPQAGFEVYGEWGREERPLDLGDLLREPDWTQAYVFGVGKLISAGESRYRVWGELVHLGQSAAVRYGRGFVSYYTHSGVTQGHTNRGQLLGAAIGPGSDAQSLGIEAWWTSASFGASLQRVRYDDDTYYQRFARFYGESRHDAELTTEVRLGRGLGPFDVTLVGRRSRRYDRDFLAARTGASTRQVESNWNMQLDLKWNAPQVLSRK